MTDDAKLPKGQMRQPEVRSRVAPDQPNAARHEDLRATWAPDQRWETLVSGCETWVPVGEGGPTWDNNQEYRRAAE